MWLWIFLGGNLHHHPQQEFLRLAKTAFFSRCFKRFRYKQYIIYIFVISFHLIFFFFTNGISSKKSICSKYSREDWRFSLKFKCERFYSTWNIKIFYFKPKILIDFNWTYITEEAVALMFSVKKLFLACNIIKKEALAQVFSCEFWKIFKSTFFYLDTSGGCFYNWYYD